MGDTSLKMVYVHAWETGPGLNGGFYWYPKKADALAAFENGVISLFGGNPENVADFYFEVAVPRQAKLERITDLIDDELHEHCAKATTRRVGTAVLAYWRRNKFKMGGATRCAAP